MSPLNDILIPSAQQVDRENEAAQDDAQRRETERVEADRQAMVDELREQNRRRDLTLDDVDAIEADAKAQLEQLQQRRQRLAPEALTNSHAGDRLTELEAEIADVERTLDRIPLARAEAARRRQEAERLAAERRPFLEEAAQLKDKRVKAAAAVDKAARAYAAALKSWDAITTEQSRVLHRAGRDARSALPHPRIVESGLLRALIDAELPRGIIRLESTPQPRWVVPLAQSDALLGEVQADE